MYSEKKFRKRIALTQPGNALFSLVAIHLIVFVLFAFLKVGWLLRYQDNQQLANFYFTKNALNWFTLPVDTGKLIKQPWSILTYMFIHVSIWKVFANMLWLWSFGYIMRELTGNKKIIPVFIYGSLAGALAFIIAYQVFPSLHPFIADAHFMGASAGVIAIAIATTIIAPGYRLFPMLNGGIPLWVLTMIFIAIDVLTISRNDTATYLAHAAGMITGFLFIFFLRRGYDGSQWMNRFAEWVSNLFNPDKPKKGKDRKKELYYKSGKEPFTKSANLTQQKVDEILDKINQHGYDHLTEEEKEILKRASKEEM